MSKRILFLLLISMMLTACGTKQQSWENENTTVANMRIQEDGVTAEWTLDQNQASSPDGGTLIRLAISKKDGGRIDKFDIENEKLLHLIVVSKDLSYFNHIHPVYKGNGIFEIVNHFPTGGDYLLIADFTPSGGDSMSKKQWVHVDGKPATSNPIVPDPVLEKTFDGKRVTLSMDQQLAAKVPLTLTFSFRDEKTGQPITDLQPYLGTIGHVVIVSEHGEQYLHVHADEGQGNGPTATFETEFPRSGIYKIWGQFQRGNHVFIASYVVRVP